MSRFFLHTCRNLLKHFCLYLGVILGMMIIAQSVGLSDLWILFGVSVGNILKPIIYMLIPYLSFAMTLAFFLATLTTYHSQCEEGAYPALITAGYPWLRSFTPVLFVAALVSLACLQVSEHLEHRAHKAFYEFRQEKTYQKLQEILQNKLTPKTFHKDFTGYIFRSESVSEDQSHFEDVFITTFPSPPGSPLLAITAPKATLTYHQSPRTMTLRLMDGILISASIQATGQTQTKFKTWDIDILSLFQRQLFGEESTSQNLHHLSPQKLKESLVNIKNPNHLKVAYKILAAKSVAPWSLFVLALFAIALGIHAYRFPTSTLYLKALIIWLGYIISNMSVTSLPGLSPSLAAWLPLMVFALLGLCLLRRRLKRPLAEKLL